MEYKNKQNNGVVLVTVVIFALIISILAVSVLFVMTNEARVTEHQIDRIQANYAAQAGIQHYLGLIRSDPTFGDVLTDWTASSIGTIPVDIDRPASPFPAECPSGDPSAECIRATADY